MLTDQRGGQADDIYNNGFMHGIYLMGTLGVVWKLKSNTDPSAAPRRMVKLICRITHQVSFVFRFHTII